MGSHQRLESDRLVILSTVPTMQRLPQDSDQGASGSGKESWSSVSDGNVRQSQRLTSTWSSATVHMMPKDSTCDLSRPLEHRAKSEPTVGQSAVAGFSTPARIPST